MSEVILTSANFEEEVLKSEIPVLVDFWATWCGPCQALGPIVSEVAEENEGKIKVCKVDVDEQRDLAMKYRVMSVPTLLAFKNGEIYNRSVGLQPKEAVLDLFAE